MAPHWPGRRLRTPPGQDSPSPPGRCARFSAEDGPPLALAGGSDHPLGWTPRPPRAGAPGYWKMMAPHGPCRRFPPPPGLGSPSPPGRCARLLQELHCPLPPGSEAVHCRRSTAHCPRAVRQCIARVALPAAPRQWGSALQEFHCPVPPGSEAVRCRSSTAHCPQAVRQCIAGVALPTAPGQ